MSRVCSGSSRLKAFDCDKRGTKLALTAPDPPLRRKGLTMRGLALSAVALIGAAASVANAQATGTSDNSSNVTSQRLNTPVGNNDLTSQYEQQRALNNLPEQQKRAVSKLGASRPAKPDELVAGAVINDKAGVFIAKIQKIDPDGVVVANGFSAVKIPADAFGHNKAGLLLDTLKADFDKLVAQAH